MIARLILLLALVFAALWFARWFIKTPPEQVAKALKRGALYGLGGVLILLVLSGRLNWLVAAAAAAIPLLKRGIGLIQLVPLARKLHASFRSGGFGGFGDASGAGPDPDDGRSSNIQTRFLRMSLDHGSGVMDGDVLEGRFGGRRLSGLEMHELLLILSDYRAADGQSAALLEAYLDRTYGPEWRDRTGPEADDETPRGAAGSASGRMGRDEAYQVLGLEPGASPEAIREAHRRLIQKLHPDRGGSTFLATKINQAKDVLLG